MHRRAFLMAVAALSMSAAQAQAADDPKAIVEQIYKISAGKDGKYSETSAFFRASFRKLWFSKSLLAAVNAMDRKDKRTNDTSLDFDPVTDSQDPSVKNLTISVESQDGAASVVAAKFFAEGAKDPNFVRYIFIREGGGWKLDNMRAERGKDNWDLRKLIK